MLPQIVDIESQNIKQHYYTRMQIIWSHDWFKVKSIYLYDSLLWNVVTVRDRLGRFLRR